MSRRPFYAAVCVLAVVGLVPEASAQPVADFYRGKTIRFVIGSGVL
jgi:hypothetical protein